MTSCILITPCLRKSCHSLNSGFRIKYIQLYLFPRTMLLSIFTSVLSIASEKHASLTSFRRFWQKSVVPKASHKITSKKGIFLKQYEKKTSTKKQHHRNPTPLWTPTEHHTHNGKTEKYKEVHHRYKVARINLELILKAAGSGVLRYLMKVSHSSSGTIPCSYTSFKQDQKKLHYRKFN